MREECDICRGRGSIRLPIYRAPSAVYTLSDTVPVVAEETSRDYPCPQCADAVRPSRIAVCQREVGIATYITDPGYTDHVKRSLAHQFVDHLLEYDYIRFERSRNLTTYDMRATLGVVSPRHVATIEERAKEHQTRIALQWAAEAKAQINNWGAYYGSTDITKTQACRLIDSAVRAPAEKWKEI